MLEIMKQSIKRVNISSKLYLKNFF